MKMQKWNDIKNKGKSPERIAEVARRVKTDLLAMDLVELRKEAGLTQTDVANELDMTQSEISRLEKRDDRLISTLRKYIEALGGELEVVAVIGNKRITLNGI